MGRMADEPLCWLVRHARPQASDGVLLGGGSDAPLAAEGEAQARRLADWCVGRIPARTLVCSPLRRAHATASALAVRLGLEVQVWDDLREVGFGRWEGLPFARVAARDPGLVEGWMADEDRFTFPEGEAVAAFQVRMRMVAQRLAGLEAPLVVAHGGVCATLITIVLGLPFRSRLAFPCRHAQVATVRGHAGTGTLEGFNQGPDPGG